MRALQRGRETAQARLADALDKTGNDWTLIIDILRDAVHHSGSALAHPDSSEFCRLGLISPAPETDDCFMTAEEEADEILDRMMDATTGKQAIVRKLSLHQIKACLELAIESAERARESAVMTLERELQVRSPF